MGKKDWHTQNVHDVLRRFASDSDAAHVKRTRIARYAKDGITIEDLAQTIASKYKIAGIDI